MNIKENYPPWGPPISAPEEFHDDSDGGLRMRNTINDLRSLPPPNYGTQQSMNNFGTIPTRLPAREEITSFDHVVSSNNIRQRHNGQCQSANCRFGPRNHETSMSYNDLYRAQYCPPHEFSANNGMARGAGNRESNSQPVRVRTRPNTPIFMPQAVTYQDRGFSTFSPPTSFSQPNEVMSALEKQTTSFMSSPAAYSTSLDYPPSIETDIH